MSINKNNSQAVHHVFDIPYEFSAPVFGVTSYVR